MRNGLMGIAVMALALVGTVAGAEERIELKVGQTHVLPTKALKRVAVGDADVVDVKPGGQSEVSLTGREVGSTTLVTWSGDEQKMLTYTVVVTDGGATPTK
ncbi:pilus assembly protein N-terminal domain-containing protein [Myxococcus stipitatus]|uniref:pilus assembly protein N-terminal domain-containing protein n=1 Tax=Myxococcus stipitatus TaxID=83455 RepID=UPI001F41621E|nr:pilus assembly protein N-terminal domain-containing protein [Myxococcus stipitatus]MCE9668522.1 pilus assembly protein N-terminal domain-containing protein [Myxococcus stipitatus]